MVASEHITIYKAPEGFYLHTVILVCEACGMPMVEEYAKDHACLFSQFPKPVPFNQGGEETASEPASREDNGNPVGA